MIVNTILKCIEVWRKPICYGLQWDEIATSSAESVFSFTKESIDSGEDYQCSYMASPQTYRYHSVASMTFVVTSFGETEKGDWFFPHKADHHSHHCKQLFSIHMLLLLALLNPSSDNLIMPITRSLVCPQLAPSLQPFLCYSLISFVMSFVAPTWRHKKKKPTLSFSSTNL